MKNTNFTIQLTGTFNDDEDEILSDCCAADVYEDHMICSDCNDHCGIQEEDDLVEEIGHSMVAEALHA